MIDKNSPIPQYFQLQTWLIEQLEEGRYHAGDKIPTEHELVQKTGLARATVRQAIGNLVNLGYLTRKRRHGTFVRDRKSFGENRTIVGILIPDIRTGYAPELARGAEDEAAKHKHSLILCNTDDSFDKADEQADRLIEAGVSGVIYIPTATSDQKNRLIIERFTSRNIPVVLADRTISNLDIDHVTTNNLEGATQITNYMISKGHTRIAILLTTLFSTERERLAGYQAALTAHNIEIDESLIYTNGGEFSKEHYLALAKSILQKRHDFTAVFAGHDRIALAFYSAAKELGISIPGDLSLVGYDDLPLITISLTTMHQPIYEMGQESFRLILSRIQGNQGAARQTVLTSHLVERTSVTQI
jgi:DNA-binding LacI/PurR family transcriptional regulator